MKDIKLVSSEEGDWEAIYIDGKKALENHSLDAIDVLAALKLKYTRQELSTEWLEENGYGFPVDASDLP